MTAVEQIIYSVLTSDADVAALVGDRVYPVVRPGDTAVPAIAYQLIDNVRHHGCGGASGWAESRWQLNCWAATFDGAIALAEAAIKALDGWSGARVDHIFVVDEGDLPAVEPANEQLTFYGRRLDVQIHYNE